MTGEPRTAEDVVFDALVANNGTETVAAPYPASLRPIARAVMEALEAYWLSPEWLDSPAARLSAMGVRAEALGELSVQAMGRQHTDAAEQLKCWTWFPGQLFGGFCECGHIDLAHNRDGWCSACA